MAKYHDMGIADISFIAAADLTAKQYHFVMPGSVFDEVVLATGASNGAPLGVLQNSPSAGQEARVRILGFTKLVVENGTCTLGFGRNGFCASDGQGEMVTVATSPVNFRYLGPNVTVAGSYFGEALLLGGWGASGLSTC